MPGGTGLAGLTRLAVLLSEYLDVRLRRRPVEGVSVHHLARQDVDDRRVGEVLQHAHLRRDAGVGMNRWRAPLVVALGAEGLGARRIGHPGGQERHRRREGCDRENQTLRVMDHVSVLNSGWSR